jgi:hypothetical protein
MGHLGAFVSLVGIDGTKQNAPCEVTSSRLDMSGCLALNNPTSLGYKNFGRFIYVKLPENNEPHYKDLIRKVLPQW